LFAQGQKYHIHCVFPCPGQANRLKMTKDRYNGKVPGIPGPSCDSMGVNGL